jgi:hypothetical protein
MIGILAGENRQGTIDNVTVNGAIVSTSSGSASGGFVGVNLGTISNSTALVTLTATLNDSVTGLLDQSTQIGAIAGRNNAAITNVSAAGTISVELNATVSSKAVFGAQIGGLVGLSDSGSQIAGSRSIVNISAAFSGSAFATPPIALTPRTGMQSVDWLATPPRPARSSIAFRAAPSPSRMGSSPPEACLLTRLVVSWAQVE